MDRVVVKKKWPLSRILSILAGTGLVIVLAYMYWNASGKSRLNVDTERLSVAEIKMGTFKEYIPVMGTVQPQTSIYLDALEGGRVEEKYVEDGAIMKKGQSILRLSNTDLELSLANQETQVFNVLTQMQIAKNNADQNSINRQNQMAEVDNALKEAERVFNLNKKLVAQKVIGEQDYLSSKNLYEYQLRRKQLAEDIMKKDAVSMAQQLEQMKESYDKMKSTLALMRKKVGDLVVKSPIDGQLTSLDAEIGESKNKGQRLGQLDAVGGFKVRVPIDEHYISRIFTGQKGEFSFANETYNLEIRKVYTQVTGGRFQVDMLFTGKVPDGIRRGQTLQIRLALSDETQALLLPRGGFYQQTGGNWIFKLTENGSVAYKTDIQIGRQSPDYYEVLSGLKPGDKVITNSYENYGDIQELVLKNNP
ncbi:MAG TPA: HlyD family efflux transporter periplasmic adaptor subunit [Catalimonadaceae bacterium]|nr:HlyD family efflux transporter periplasmic adaptor subunit [Catalimonadaceae bacterium]